MRVAVQQAKYLLRILRVVFQNFCSYDLKCEKSNYQKIKLIYIINVSYLLIVRVWNVVLLKEKKDVFCLRHESTSLV